MLLVYEARSSALSNTASFVQCQVPGHNCLRMIHMSQIADNSIQLIAWAFKVEWQRHQFSLPELQISFAHPGETFIGMWCAAWGVLRHVI